MQVGKFHVKQFVDTPHWRMTHCQIDVEGYKTNNVLEYTIVGGMVLALYHPFGSHDLNEPPCGLSGSIPLGLINDFF